MDCVSYNINKHPIELYIDVKKHKKYLHRGALRFMVEVHNAVGVQAMRRSGIVNPGSPGSFVRYPRIEEKSSRRMPSAVDCAPVCLFTDLSCHSMMKKSRTSA